ncbi:MAG: hypothetical protein GY938_25295 [Ketobacter sp.]|nr:hypothetical protein [Ketobacter sp.]
MTALNQPDIEPKLGDDLHEDEPALGAASPFDDGDVEGLFFPGGGRQELLDQIAHLLRYGPSLLLLYGDQGVGKHYLIDRLLSQLDPDLFDVALVQADVLMNPEVLLAGLSGPWHSRAPFNVASLQPQLVECASAADDASRVLLLVVSHSQFLDDGSVELLSIMLASCAGLPVKVVLVLDASDPEDVMQLSPLFDQVPDHFRALLAPLTRNETAAYLAYRLHTGGLGHVHFSEAHVDQIFNHSLGNVVRVNQIAAELLLASLPAKSKSRIKTDLPWMHLGALVLVVGLLLFLVLSRDNATGHSPALDAGSSVTTDLASGARLSSEPAVNQSPLANEPSAIPEPSTSKTQAEPIKAEPVVSESVTVTEIEQAAEPVSKPIKEETAASEAKTALAASDKPPAKAEAVKQPEAVVVPKPKEAPKQTPKQTDARTAWILSLPPEHYALQLLGAKEKSTVDKFLAMYPSVQKLSYYKTQRNGAPWFVVVQASFPNYEAAKAAVAKLPQKLQKQGPWIRKIEAIQKDLKN